MKDHLFISYATEDFVLAEWLALRLTSEGYRVWCDRFQLLGGESYPRDIDKAMKEKTFRVLALLSHNSINKDNPVKERTMALNIGKERGIDFLIPLNVDGLKPTELDWMTGDITYIPFYKGWANGFSHLLKKLDSINAPRPVKNGREIAARVYLNHMTLKNEKEVVYSNCIMVKRIPDELLMLRFKNELSPHEQEVLRDTWAFYPIDNRHVYAFLPPPHPDLFRYIEIDRIDWKNNETISGIFTKNIIKNLLKNSLYVKCLQMGLRRSEVGLIYFPFGLFENENLLFRSYTGRGNRFKVAGERHFPYEFRYHLSPSFRIKNIGDDFIAQIFINFYITELSGFPIDSKRAVTRHKALRKTLYNNDFLIRCMGICEYLSNDNMEIIIGDDDGKIIFDGRLIAFDSPVSIDESRVKEISEEDLLFGIGDDLEEETTIDVKYEGKNRGEE